MTPEATAAGTPGSQWWAIPLMMAMTIMVTITAIRMNAAALCFSLSGVG